MLVEGYPSELIHGFAVIDTHSFDNSLLMSPKLEVSTARCWAQSWRCFWIVSSIHFWFTVGWRLDFGTTGVAQSFIDSSHVFSTCLNRKGSDEMPETKTSQIVSLRCTSAVTSSWSQSLEKVVLTFAKNLLPCLQPRWPLVLRSLQLPHAFYTSMYLEIIAVSSL